MPAHLRYNEDTKIRSYEDTGLRHRPPLARYAISSSRHFLPQALAARASPASPTLMSPHADTLYRPHSCKPHPEFAAVFRSSELPPFGSESEPRWLRAEAVERALGSRCACAGVGNKAAGGGTEPCSVVLAGRVEVFPLAGKTPPMLRPRLSGICIYRGSVSDPHRAPRQDTQNSLRPVALSHRGCPGTPE